MFQYHVTFGVHKKLVSVFSKHKSSIVEAVQQAFQITGDNFVIQSWDAVFSDWAEVADTSQLPDIGKLQVVLTADGQLSAVSAAKRSKSGACWEPSESDIGESSGCQPELSHKLVHKRAATKDINCSSFSNVMDIAQDVMKKYLSGNSETLEVKNEVEICEILLEWLKQHTDAGNKVQPDQLLPFIRWSGISVDYVRSTLLQNEILTSDQGSITFLSKVITYMMTGVQFEGLQTHHRASTGVINYMMTVGLGSNSQTNSTQVSLISLQKRNKVISLTKVPGSLYCSTAACVFKESVYIIGTGGESNKKVWKWDQLLGWIECGHMPKGRDSHSVAVVDSTLYVLGGTSEPSEKPLKRVDGYKTRTNQWSPAGRLVRAVKDAACVTYENRIYLFGGVKKRNVGIDYVQIYNPTQENCTLMNRPMPFEQERYAGIGVKAVLWDTSVILLSSRSCYIYDFKTQIWQAREQFKTGVDDFALALDNSTIYIAGGSSEDAESEDDDDDSDDDDDEDDDDDDDDDDDSDEDIFDDLFDDENLTYTDAVKSVSVLDIMRNKPADWKDHAKLEKPGSPLAFVLISYSDANTARAVTTNAKTLSAKTKNKASNPRIKIKTSKLQNKASNKKAR